MSWRQFELAAAEAFRAQGYEVELTDDGADGGVDLILDRDGERTFVQCKHWAAWKVGVKTVRELYGVMNAHGVRTGIVVTSGRFTEEAREFAAGVPVRLYDGRDMADMLAAVPLPAALRGIAAPTASGGGPSAWDESVAAARSSARRAEDAAAGPGSGWQPRCPRCGEPMVMRTTRRGVNAGAPFWGCPRYPTCRGMVRFAGAMQAPDRSAPPPPGARPLRGTSRPPRRRSGAGWRVLVAVAAVVVGLALMRPLLTAGEWLRAVGAAAPVSAMGEPRDPVMMSSIQLPERPHQVAVDSAGRRLFVSNRDANSITVVDLDTKAAMATLPLAQQPMGIAFDPVEQTLWVTNFNDASVTVVTPGGKHVRRLRVGQGPDGIAIDSSARRAFIINSVDESVTIVDLGTKEVTQTWEPGHGSSGAAVDVVTGGVCLVWPIGLTLMPRCYSEELRFSHDLRPVGDLLAIDSVRHDWYGVHRELRMLTAFDAVTGEKSEVSLPHTPTGVAVDEVTRMVYVVLPDAKSIWVASPLS